MDAPRAVLFDAYGTLFDVHSVAWLAEQLFPGQGPQLSQLWRDKQIEYTRLLTTSNEGAHYRPFWEVTEAALRWTARRLRLPWSEDAQRRLMNQYRHLSAFPEDLAVLQALKAHGVRAGILSNGDPAMLAVAVKSAGLQEWLDPVISVDAVRRYKTHPDAYALGPAALALPVQQIVFVSSNAWDALGATWFGYPTLWVDRQQLPFEELGTAPTRTGRSLLDVLAFFDIQRPQE